MNLKKNDFFLGGFQSLEVKGGGGGKIMKIHIYDFHCVDKHITRRLKNCILFLVSS